MSGILIYSKAEAERNAFAVKKFTDNLDVRLVYEEELDLSFPCDYVINRTNNYKIALAFEKKGIRVFNPSSLSLISNDKKRCYEFMQENGIEIMPIGKKTAPVVEKSRNGKGGAQVRLITEDGFELREGFVYQEPASDLGMDLRVWLIGGEIIASVLRRSSTDFRANFCLGGEAVPYSLSDEEKNLVFRIADLIDYDYIGIDFVFNNGRIVFNEIEDSVGARMVYSKTDIDILKLYCNYIRRQTSMEKIAVNGSCARQEILNRYKGMDARILFNVLCSSDKTKYDFSAVFFVGECDREQLNSWVGNEHMRLSADEEELFAELDFYFGIPKPYEIERKFLIAKPDEKMLDSLEYCDYVEISQAYVLRDGKHFRIRKRGRDGNYVYIKTEKKRVTDLVRTEIETRISKEEFETAAKGFKMLSKRRYMLVHNGKYFELDIFPFWQNKAILEIELKSEHECFTLPPFFEVIREVSSEKAYRNSYIAGKHGVLYE